MSDLKEGIYEEIINEAVQKALEEHDSKGIFKETIPSDSSSDILSRYLQKILLRGLNIVKETANKQANGLSDTEKERKKVEAQITACNKIIEELSALSDSEEILNYRVGKSGERLLSVWNSITKNASPPIRPRTSISVSRLFTGGAGGFQLSDELNREIRSSNKVDFLVSFIKNSGINTVRTALEEFTRNGGKLRILTTTYMGATEPNVINYLAKLPNTEVRISYDSENTRLHAKSYIFERDNGFSTVYIGSSNLSRAAVTDGMEWNVKLTNQDAPQVIQEVRSTFEIYWNSDSFKPYDPERDYDTLRKAVGHERNRDRSPDEIVFFDIVPHPFQEELLQELKAQREIHGNYRNLVVAATGTGKTIISAFDYKYFCDEHPNDANRLLFIAHREEILNQSLLKFRAVLKRMNFGEKFVGGSEPESYDYLFASIQTFNSRKVFELPEDYYDFIIVDEVHHGCAESYRLLLEHFKPKILLGLTATPERMDGMDIRRYFNDTISCEIRLADAINRELLVPFQYFAIADKTDISRITFSRGRFDTKELTDLYLDNDERLECIWDAIKRYYPDTDSIKCLGFCVSVIHAKYMADKFNEHGLKAIALTAESSRELRESVSDSLRNGKVNFVFTVDLFNEGVDIPEINVELLLRPTESLTIFIQQLGRGLRKSPNKSELIVLDFVGQFKQNYHIYEEKLQVLTSCSAMSVAAQIKGGFDGLPLGCYIELEPVAREYILRNINPNIGNKKDFINKIRTQSNELGRCPRFSEFLQRYTVDPRSIYKKDTTFYTLCKEAGVLQEEIYQKEIKPSALLRICDINSRRWIREIVSFLKQDIVDNEENRRYATMLYYTFSQQKLSEEYSSIWDFIRQLRSEKQLCDEICELLDYNLAHIDFVDEEVDLGYPHALDLYCRYTKDQILAALGKSTPERAYPWREGVLFLKDYPVPTDIFLINLNKELADYSPATLYDDYPISPTLFHWQSQSGATPQTGDGLRYVSQNTLGTDTLLFVREKKKGQYGTLPYVFLGKASYVSHEGEKPISITWKMEREIPAKVLAWSPTFKG